LAIDSKGKLYAWGRADGGQLGIPKETIEKTPDIESLGVAIPRLIISDCVIRDIAAGVAHSIACTNEGKCFGWGWGNYGQLGLGYTGDNFELGTGNQSS
jgi:alpha-tubulin suppressor-like RCC1 family protein